MKPLKLVLIALLFVFAGCNETLFEDESVINDDALKSGVKNPLTFESEFQLTLESRTDVYVHDDGLPGFDQVVTGTGKARHLGKTELIVEETIYVNEYPFVGVAKVTFIAANGARLIFNTTSEISYLGDPAEKVMKIVTISSEFEEGTGRFKKAIDGALHKTATFYDAQGTGVANYSATVFFKK